MDEEDLFPGLMQSKEERVLLDDQNHGFLTIVIPDVISTTTNVDYAGMSEFNATKSFHGEDGLPKSHTVKVIGNSVKVSVELDGGCRDNDIITIFLYPSVVAKHPRHFKFLKRNGRRVSILVTYDRVFAVSRTQSDVSSFGMQTTQESVTPTQPPSTSTPSLADYELMKQSMFEFFWNFWEKFDQLNNRQ